MAHVGTEAGGSQKGGHDGARLLTLAEIAVYLGVCTLTARRMNLPECGWTDKAGRRIRRYRQSDVDAWLDSRGGDAA